MGTEKQNKQQEMRRARCIVGEEIDVSAFLSIAENESKTRGVR